MNVERMDFSYEISDERLLAYSQLPLLDRLRWLDAVSYTHLDQRGDLVLLGHAPSGKRCGR